MPSEVFGLAVKDNVLWSGLRKAQKLKFDFLTF